MMKFWDNWENYVFKRGKSFFWKCLIVLCEHYGQRTGICASWRPIAVEGKHSKQLTQMTMNPELSERQRQLTTNSKTPVMNWHPYSMKVFFGRKTGPAMLAPVNCKLRKSDSKVTDEIYISKQLEFCHSFFLENFQVSPEIGHLRLGHPPVRANHCLNHLEP